MVVKGGYRINDRAAPIHNQMAAHQLMKNLQVYFLGINE
jgi:hypothetical protein